MKLAAAVLLLLGFSIATAQPDETAASKRSAYPKLEHKPPTSTKPRTTAAEQEKLEKIKKELNSARDHQSPAKTKESGSSAKAEKPLGYIHGRGLRCG